MRVKILPDDDRFFFIGVSVKDKERVEMLLFLRVHMGCPGWTLGS